MDNTIKEIIEEIAEELNISKVKVENIIRHFFNWQRDSFINLKFSTYYWKYFGKFSIIKKRHDAYIKRINKTNKTIKIKDNGKNE